MYRIPLFDEDRVLLLSPRWGEMGGFLQWFLLGLVCAVPLGLIFWLYRYEMKLVAARTARVLLALRTLAIGLLLLLVTLQPVYARVTREELPGRVILAVDVSESMHVADPQREPVDKLKLARALKIGGDLVSGSQLDDWIQQYEDKKAIRFVAPEEFPTDANKRRFEENARKKVHDTLCERIDNLTRTQAAKQLLSPEGVRFLKRLTDKHQVELFGFASDAQEVKLEALNELFQKDTKKETTPKKEKDDEEKKDEKPAAAMRFNASDLGQPLARALERSGAGRGKILGVIMLTDGLHNVTDTPISPTKKSRELKDQEIPLYPIAFGATKPPMDASILAVAAPNSAFKDVEAAVKVRFKTTGLKAQDLKVLVHKPGEEAEPLDQRIIKHDGKDQEYFESFQVRLDKEGRQPIQVTLLPQGEDVKEVNTNNNKQSFVINVADDTSKVLLVDGEGRWEFHYIWQALLRDRSMKVRSVLFTQPRLGKVPEKELEKLNHPLPSLPPATMPDHDPLMDYDCIILGDVMAEQLPAVERARLEKYVADRGGTLVILAGKRAMPMAYLDARAVEAPKAGNIPADVGDLSKDPLIRMLPITDPRVVAPEDGFGVTLTEEGKLTDYLKIESEGLSEDNLKRWAEMPKHHWGVIGKVKPGAMTLAHVAPADEGGKTLTAEEKRKREDEHALMVRQNYGFGRVFYIGLDSTWRWRFRTGDLYHHRFWSQTIRWAASDKPLVTGNKFVRFGTGQALFRHDEPVKVSVRLTEEIEKLPKDMMARARILKKGEENKEVAVALVPLKARPFQPRVLDAQIRDLPEGEYLIELTIPELDDKLQAEPGPDGKVLPLRASFKVSPGESGEMVRLGTDYTLLKELADKNGLGKVYTPETAGELIELLNAKGMSKTESSEDPLWRWWVTLVVILSLLTIEWVLRKWAGLP